MSEAAPIETLELLPECQARAELDSDAVDDYAERYKAGDPMPPIDVFLVGARKVVVDGFHRFAAATKAGVGFLRFDVVGEGTLDAASWHAAGVNKDHGVRRTTADKRRAVRMALDGIGAEQSNRVLADHVGVSHELVRKVRAKWEAERGDGPTERIGADGKRYPAAAAGGNGCHLNDEGGGHAGASGESPNPPPGDTGTSTEGGSPTDPEWLDDDMLDPGFAEPGAVEAGRKGAGKYHIVEHRLEGRVAAAKCDHRMELGHIQPAANVPPGDRCKTCAGWGWPEPVLDDLRTYPVSEPGDVGKAISNALAKAKGAETPSRDQAGEPWTAEPMPGDEEQLEQLREAARSIRLEVRSAFKGEGPRTSLRQRVEEHLERVEKALECAKAVVCPTCEGDGCPRCGGRGWTTKGTVVA